MEQAKALMTQAKGLQAAEHAKHEPYIHQEVFGLIKGLSGSKASWWTRIRVAVTALRMIQGVTLKGITDTASAEVMLQRLRGVLNERTMPGTSGKTVGCRVLVKAPKGYLAAVTLSDGEDSVTLLCKADGPIIAKRDAQALSLIM